MPYRTLNELANRPILVPPGIPKRSPTDPPYIHPSARQPGFNSDGVALFALGAAALKLVDATGKCVIVIWEGALAGAH
jgi:hypothetical protein